MATAFFDATGTCPPGHTQFSWEAPPTASPGLLKLAQAGHVGAANAVEAMVARAPAGHTLFSWAMGSQGAAAAPEALVQRVEALEALASAIPSNVAEVSRSDNHLRVQSALSVAGVKGACLFKVPSDYYDWTLAQRAAHLEAPIDSLCKTVLLENTAAVAPGVTASAFTSRFVAVVLQYVTKLDMPRLAKQLKGAAAMTATGTPPPPKLTIPAAVAGQVTVPRASAGAGAEGPPTPAQLEAAKFNFAVAPAEASDALSGFLHNAVTPFGMTTPLPVLVTRGVAALPSAHPSAPYVWLGGGQVDLKLRLPVVQLVAALGAREVNAAVPRSAEEAD